MGKFIPTPAYPDRMPVDISFVFEEEKPAGKHGFLQVDGEHFRFEDGTRPKFWGVCLSGSANFPEHDYAEKLANRLASAGVNCVRTHWMDSEFNTPNIFQFTKGKRVSTTRALDPKSMDRLDYLVYCLEQQGIYIYFDNMTFRKFKSGDGVLHAEDLDNAAKPYSMFDPKMIELQKEYITQIWTHYNPYTKKVNKDDPAFILTEVINETDLFSDMKRKKSLYYEQKFRELYRDYLARTGIEDDWENRNMYADEEPVRSFKVEVTENYYREIYNHLRATGVRIPINGTNWYHNSVSNVKTQRIMDFSDAHHYYYDWCWSEENPVCSNAQINGYPYVAANLPVMRINKPFYVSEWDMPWPNDFRAEGPIYYAAITAFQDWDGMGIFCYHQGRDPEKMGIIGSEMSSFTLGGYSFEPGPMSVWNDPAKFGLFQTAALIVRRGDISPAKKTVALMTTNDAKTSLESRKTGLEKHKLVTVFDEEMAKNCDEILPDTTHFTYDDPNVIESDTGEMKRYLQQKIGVIDTPRTKVVYGMLARNRYAVPAKQGLLPDFEVRGHVDFGVVSLCSLTNDPTTTTDNMLLTTIGRACNTDTVRCGDEILELGHEPIISEVIEADIGIRTDRTDLKVWGVNPEGYYIGEIPAVFEDGWMRFKVGDLVKASYYLVVAE